VSHLVPSVMGSALRIQYPGPFSSIRFNRDTPPLPGCALESYVKQVACIRMVVLEHVPFDKSIQIFNLMDTGVDVEAPGVRLNY